MRTWRTRSQVRRSSGDCQAYHRGFTFIELMGAVTLLVIGAYAVFMVLVVAIQTNAEAAHYAIARVQAQQIIETWRVNPLTSMHPVPDTPLRQLPMGSYSVTSDLQNLVGQTPLILVTVTVTWREPGRGSDRFQLATYICKGGISIPPAGSQRVP